MGFITGLSRMEGDGNLAIRIASAGLHEQHFNPLLTCSNISSDFVAHIQMKDWIALFKRRQQEHLTASHSI
jgi:hypothetical protein